LNCILRDGYGASEGRLGWLAGLQARVGPLTSEPEGAPLIPMSETPAISPAVLDHIRDTVAGHDVVLFMKGKADQPQCGFSSVVVQILDHLEVDFHDVNVLADNSLREGVKQFTNWPTVPQLYVKGEFVGGCDIVREMFQTGELKTLLAERGLIS
jgi:monothiol glutaredoxin